MNKNMNQCPCSGKNLTRLLRPAVLSLLAQEDMHGYNLVRHLHQSQIFTISQPDISSVYKCLKSLEKENLVISIWQDGEQGPAKRCYSITVNGLSCLQRWNETLEDYRRQIDALLTIIPSSPLKTKGEALGQKINEQETPDAGLGPQSCCARN